MIRPAYYNEIDPIAAQWLRNLIAARLIAPGDVDERSIEDVYPDDLRPYTQCHFFAGIGVWSYALRQAGWPDDRPVWTGSCPCQPFSAAGKGSAFADERHLWPAFHHLIKERRPAIIIGEQVASKDADAWLDLVQADMEALGYAFGAVAFPSAGVGAPHIRDRTYWMADAGSQGLVSAAHARVHCSEKGAGARNVELERHSDVGGMDQPESNGLQVREQLHAELRREGFDEGRDFSGLADADGKRHEKLQSSGASGLVEWDNDKRSRNGFESGGTVSRPGPVNGFWGGADWLLCRDGKWRPVEPGTFPLVNGAPARVGRLRAYGNAINAEAAKVFVMSAMEAMDKRVAA